MTDKIMIDGEKLERIKQLLFEGQRMAISTKTFEAIIEELQRKTQELFQCHSELVSESQTNKNMLQQNVVLMQKLTEKEQECKELKERLAVVNFEIESLRDSQEPYAQYVDRYKQALEKIEEILTNAYCLTNYTCKETAEIAKKLITIINEVKNER